jgi:heptosyltransferase II
MNTLIIKLNASGDVVRTTTLLRALPGNVTWVTAAANTEFFAYDTAPRCFEWADRERAMDRHYDLVINLEDEVQQAQFVGQLQYTRLFGAYVSDAGVMAYTEDSREWFDLSLISNYGRQQADARKLQNRRTYQDLIFDGLGLTFTGQPYVLPRPKPSALVGDVAIAPVAGAVWPMKSWAYYDQLKVELEATGLSVNVLPMRNSLLHHLADVGNHRCLVGGDSLPMHFALGTATPCVTLFNCTSPWEIYDYGLQTKLVSPLLEKYFYKRDFDVAATTAIRLEDVFDAVMERLKHSPQSSESI